MASAMYNTGKQKIVNGTITWGSNDPRVLLLKTGYTFDPTHDFVSDLTPASYEITVSGYSRQALTGESLSVDDVNDWVEFDAADATFSSLAAGETIVAAVVYEYNASDASAQLIAYIDVADTATNGGDVTIQWSSSGIFYV